MPVLFLKHQNMKKIYNLLYNRFNAKLKAEPRLYTKGVSHQNGCLYATDGFIAAKIPAKYSEDLEGLLIDKKGEKIDTRYPSIDSVLPNWADTDLIELDLKQLEKACKNVQRVNVKDRFGTKYAAIKLDEGLCFQAHYIASIFDLFKALKEKFQFRRANNNQLLVISENYLFDDVYTTVLVMPIYVPEASDEVENSDAAERPIFTIEEALVYEKEVKPTNKAWYE